VQAEAPKYAGTDTGIPQPRRLPSENSTNQVRLGLAELVVPVTNGANQVVD
jgi:hypothetical protein